MSDEIDIHEVCLKCHGFGHGEAQCANRKYIPLEDIAFLKQQRKAPKRGTWKAFLLDLESYHLQVEVEEDQRAYARDSVRFHHHHHDAPNASKEDLFEVYLEAMELYRDTKSRFPNFKYLMRVPISEPSEQSSFESEVGADPIHEDSVLKGVNHDVEEPIDNHSALVEHEDVTSSSEFVHHQDSNKLEEPMEVDSCVVDQAASVECPNAQAPILEIIPIKQQGVGHLTFTHVEPIVGLVVHYGSMGHNKMGSQDHSYIHPIDAQIIVVKSWLQRPLRSPTLLHQSSLSIVAEQADYGHGVQEFCHSIRLIWQVAWFSIKLVVKFFLKKGRIMQELFEEGEDNAGADYEELESLLECAWEARMVT